MNIFFVFVAVKHKEKIGMMMFSIEENNPYSIGNIFESHRLSE